MKIILVSAVLMFLAGCVSAPRSIDSTAPLQTQPSAGDIVAEPEQATIGAESVLGELAPPTEDLSEVYKWVGVLERHRTQLDDPDLRDFFAELGSFRGMDLSRKVEHVNRLVNGRAIYVVDLPTSIWSADDWATPAEFFERGAVGDCEDIAIAKYFALRHLGVPVSSLRVAVVHDTEEDLAHAVLIVFTEDGPVVLDNQVEDIVPVSEAGERYRAYYQANEEFLWTRIRL